MPNALVEWMDGWVDEWMSEWMNKRKWFLKGHIIIWRQGELIVLVTHLIDNCCKWMWPGFNSSFCSLPKNYKCMPFMGVRIRRLIFQGLERIGIVLGMWVSQCRHISGRSRARLVEFSVHSARCLLFSFARWLPSVLAVCLHRRILPAARRPQQWGFRGHSWEKCFITFFPKVVSNW